MLLSLLMRLRRHLHLNLQPLSRAFSSLSPSPTSFSSRRFPICFTLLLLQLLPLIPFRPFSLSKEVVDMKGVVDIELILIVLIVLVVLNVLLVVLIRP